MEETKRKTHTSSAVKQRYNDKVYGKVSVALPKDLVARFKAKCITDGVSQAQIVKQAIEAYLSEA